MIYNPGNFCNKRIFALWLFKIILRSNLTFRIREILDESSKHNGKMPYIGFQYLFQINEKTLQNGYFNF
jgi:hypothetical protein